MRFSRFALVFAVGLEPFSPWCSATAYRITTNLGRNAGLCCYVKVRTALAVAARGQTVSQPDTLETVLERAGQHVAGFERQLAGIAAEEHDAQELQVFSVSSGSAVGGRGMDSLGVRKSARTEARRYLKADVLLLRPEGAAEWVQYRDAFDVDGQSVHARNDRLATIYTNLRPFPLKAIGVH